MPRYPVSLLRLLVVLLLLACGPFFVRPEYLAWPDWKEWEPLLEWLGSRRSRPAS